MKNMSGKHHGQGKMSMHAGQDQASHPAAPATPAEVALTAEEAASLRFMIEEEKLAGDLYEAFAGQTGLIVFDRIADSEDRHFDALVRQAERAGIDVGDLLALPAGEFADAELQAMYDELLASGSVSAEAALAVGQAVESADIADLTDTMAKMESVVLIGVYGHLLAGSERHLEAFGLELAG